jgi:nickel/cobalt transporter (NicO) family protein
MSQAVLATLAITGFVVAFFHAAIPTHWLPFVLTSRVQRWSRIKTISVTALAGTGHVAATAALGLGITWLGTAMSKSIGDWFPRIAGGVLLLFGFYYIVRQLRGRGHVHFPYPHEHLFEEHDHAHEHERPRHPTSDRAAILSLLAFLTLSPCEGFLPFYVSGIRYGWGGFALLTLILSLATVLGMVLFTSLALVGLGRIKLGLLERYESLIMGGLLCAVAVLILFFEH